MKKKLFTLLIICLLMLLIVIIYGLFPQYSRAEIKQNIGGVSICNAVYNADQHNWQYDVDYTYQNPDGHRFKIGDGTYFNREWEKNEQLVRFEKWLILKTGGWIGTDKIIVGDFKAQHWTDYLFTPESIERDTVWNRYKIHSLLNSLPSETIVKQIKGGKIELLYKFRVDDTDAEKVDSCSLTYIINPRTGKPALREVLRLSRNSK